MDSNQQHRRSPLRGPDRECPSRDSPANRAPFDQTDWTSCPPQAWIARPEVVRNDPPLAPSPKPVRPFGAQGGDRAKSAAVHITGVQNMTQRQTARSKNTRPAKVAPTQRTAGKKAPPRSAVLRNSSASRGLAQGKGVASPGTAAKIIPPAPSKKAKIEAMLRRPEGCTVAELREATSWQEHSIRAALTGLRKVGCTITLDRNEGPTRFRILGAA